MLINNTNAINNKNTTNGSTQGLTNSENIRGKKNIASLPLCEAAAGNNIPLKSATNGLVAGVALRSPTHGRSVEETVKLKAELSRIIDNLENLSPAFLEILLICMKAVKDGNIGLAKFSSDFSLISRALVSSVADSIRKQGMTQMTGAIVGGVTSFAAGAIGTGASFKGIGNQVSAANATNELTKAALNVSAQKNISRSYLIQATGQSLSSVAQGVSANYTHIAAAEQKIGEQNSSIAQSIKENTGQETEKVKELKEFLLRLIQGMADDVNASRDAGIMGCKI